MTSIPEHSKRESRLQLLLVLSALLYLTLPNIAYLLGWVHTEFSVPLCCCLIVSVLHICRDMKTTPCRVFSEKKTCLYLFIIFTAAFFATWRLGFHGQFKQHCDFIFRNAIYETLCRDTWPIYNTNGDYFVYYHTFWLIPAWLSDTFGNVLSPSFFLSLYSFIGFLLAFLLFYLKTKRIFVAFLPLLFFSPVADHYIPFSHNAINYLSALSNQLIIYNHSIPSYVCAALLYSGCMQRKWCFFPIGMLFSQSPFVAFSLGILCLFCIEYKWNGIKELINFEHISAAFLDVLVGLFFVASNGESSSFTLCPFWALFNHFNGPLNSPFFRIAYTFVILTVTVGPLFVLLSKRYRRLKLFKLTVFTAALLPLIWMGRAHNEFLYKGSLVLGIMTALLLASQLKTATMRRRVAIIIFVMVASRFTLQLLCGTIIKTLDFSEEAKAANIRNEWNGHLNHPDDYEYHNFFRKTPPRIYIGKNDIGGYIFK